MRSRSISALAAGVLLTLYPLSRAAATDQNFAQVERGRYLATAADCTACHTVPGSGKPFAGGRPIETPFGSIASANITPDESTGIGAWTDGQFENAVRKGIRPDGSRLYPAMPFNAYTKMSHDDVVAIHAYLKTIPAVHNPVVSDTLPFPFNIRAGMRAWDELYFNEGEFKPDPQKSAEWNRGAFLVQGPGHCGACHTPKSFLGGDKTSEYLHGSQLQGWVTPNITNDDTVGLGTWSVDDIATYLHTGHNRITAATGPMAEEIEDSSSKMTGSDVKAIATYLKSLPGDSKTVAPVKADDPMMKAGQAIFRDQCSACHAIDGKGVAQLFPSLADSAMLRARDPRSAIRLVLRGARSAATKAEPTAPGMPSFGRQLDDDQIAAVLTYARNAWGRPAAAVTADDVGEARRQLRARTD
ncbi:MAG TPA: c-type cytochrome [Pseudolabrys sp.]|nr:c-type cytochrome [Pseudolabrys sp.]